MNFFITQMIFFYYSDDLFFANLLLIFFILINITYLWKENYPQLYLILLLLYSLFLSRYLYRFLCTVFIKPILGGPQILKIQSTMLPMQFSQTTFLFVKYICLFMHFFTLYILNFFILKKIIDVFLKK